MKIMSISRLIKAADNIGNNHAVMEQQIQRSRDRLSAGIDLRGKTFLPYMTDRPTNHSRPLEHAAKLYNNVRYTSTKTLVGTEISATITGDAAMIARYQNAKRSLIGFSENDKIEAIDGLTTMLKGGIR